MKGLQRLAALYGRVEKMEAAAARIASDEAARTASEIVLESTWGREQQGKARSALAGEDRAEWLLAESARDFTARRISKLERVRAQREKTRDEAMQRYIASKLKTEQVTATLERRQLLEASADQRQTQVANDDRYAARLVWLRLMSTQERMKNR